MKTAANTFLQSEQPQNNNNYLIPSRPQYIHTETVFANWQQYQFPINWQESFAQKENQERKLHLEIGFGDGRYTAHRALKYPQGMYVGVELSGASVTRAIKRLQREKISNVKLLKVRAEFAVQHLFAPASLASITVNFPDPWPKDKHEENRLLRLPFFRLAASRLEPQGEIRLATDHPAYLEQACNEAKISELYNLISRPPPEAVFATKYALKWREQGKPLHYQVFQLKENIDLPNYPILERSTNMAHAILSGTIPQELKFSKVVVPYGNGHVILHEVTRTIGENTKTPKEGTSPKLLVRATIEEPLVTQQVLVSVRQKTTEKSIVIVTLEPFGDPLVTETSKGAVHVVCDWLLSQSNELRAKERAY